MMPLYFLERIQYEESIMRHELPHFHLYGYSDDYRFEGWQWTNNRNSYKLTLNIPLFFPDQVPPLYVTSPLILRSYFFYSINSQGTSHDAHTLSNGPNGCVQICHFRPENWDASQTCVAAMMKGILWLEAYEMHLRTGKEIAAILSAWERSQYDGNRTRQNF